MATASLLTARFPTHHFREQAELAVLLWGGFSLFTFALTFIVWAWRGEILVSGWDQASQIVRWYLLVIGIHLGWSVLELHIAHGQTRRKFAIQATTLVPAFAALIAALIVVTFGIEAVIYRLTGWPQAVQESQLFADVAQVHLVFLQHWLVLALWMAGGLFIAAAWYRNGMLGLGALVLAIVLSGVSGISISTDWGPFGWIYEQLTGLRAVPGWLAVLAHLAAIAGLLALTWRIVADIALRPKTV